MKLNNEDIWRARRGVNKEGKPFDPLSELGDVKFPVRVSHDLALLSKELNGQLKVIEDVRNKLVNQYGVKDDKGQISVDLNSPDGIKFAKEFNELMSIEVDLAIKKVKLPEKVASTCDACHHNMDKGYEVEANLLLALDTFIEV